MPLKEDRLARGKLIYKIERQINLPLASLSRFSGTYQMQPPCKPSATGVLGKAKNRQNGQTCGTLTSNLLARYSRDLRLTCPNYRSYAEPILELLMTIIKSVVPEPNKLDHFI